VHKEASSFRSGIRVNKTLAYRDCLVYCAQAAYVNGGFVIEHLDVTRGIAYELFYTTGLYHRPEVVFLFPEKPP
jgi:hypothetical protein